MDLPKDHPCRTCGYNISNKKCGNIIEWDADCDECSEQDTCLSMQKHGDKE